jgi:protein SERAC1
LSSLQKLASLTIPKVVINTESGLLRALEEDSEILQNITDQFAPLMANFRIFFFWEQNKTDLKYTKDYIVDEASAAPILDNTERCGIAADHRGMCKFAKNSSQGFRTVVAALRRYVQEAPQLIQGRKIKATQMLKEKRQDEAMEILGGIPISPPSASATGTPKLGEGLPRPSLALSPPEPEEASTDQVEPVLDANAS